MTAPGLLHPLAGKTFNRALPPPFVFPNASNTGPRVPPTVNVPGDITSGPGWTLVGGNTITVTGSNVTLSGLNITNCTMALNGVSNVTVTDCTFLCDLGQNNPTGSNGIFLIQLRHCREARVQYCQMSSTDNQGMGRLFCVMKDIYTDSTGTVFQYNHVFNVACGPQGERGTWAYNYIHDMGFWNGVFNGVTYQDADHTNGCTSNGNALDRLNRLNILYNTIYCATNPIYAQPPYSAPCNATTGGYNETDAISLFQDAGPQDNRLILGNLIGGGGYSLYPGYSGVRFVTGGATNIQVISNYWTTQFFAQGGTFGPVHDWFNTASNIWLNNTWYDGPNAGQAVNHP